MMTMTANYIPHKIDTIAYRRKNPEKYAEIQSAYAPIEDMWVAIDMFENNISPPTCETCGCRIKVSKRLYKRCNDCNKNKDKLSYQDFTPYMRSEYTYPLWNGVKSTDDKFTFVCPTHGEIEQVLKSHINGHGCKFCHYESIGDKIRNDHEYFLQKATAMHGDTYEYKSICTRHDDLITIHCRAHGDFKQRANVHYNGHGCPTCAFEKIKDSLTMSLEEFKEKCSLLHSGKYDYSLVNYTGSRNKVTIICPTHGAFEQVAYYHLAGNGCQLCANESVYSTSSAEKEIAEFIRENITDEVLSNYRGFENTEFDVYIPSKKLAIEYDGIYWHSSDSKDTDAHFKNFHVKKTNIAEKYGINLLHIFENEWNEKKDIWKSVILTKLGKNKKIHARQCKVVTVSFSSAKAFCEENHLQGHTPFFVAYGLELGDELVSVITIGKARYSDADYEILRFCNKKGISVVGGFSKLFANINECGVFVSYANRRWSNGNLYEQSGFIKKHISPPCYYYIKSNRLFHRSFFMKHKLSGKLEYFDANISEVDNMYANGYRRIWDCGNIVYLKEKS